MRKWVDIPLRGGLFVLFFSFISLFLVKNVTGQTCDLVVSKAGRIVPDGLCAPVYVNIFEISYGMATIPAGSTFEIFYDWGDGNTETISAIVDKTVSPNVVSANVTHDYPPRTDGSCTYEATAWLMINGVRCEDTRQPQVVTVWDEDDKNGGVIAIDPIEVEICYGEDSLVIFQDISDWNCTGADLDKPNYQDRVTRWTYGVDGSAANRIPNISIIKPDLSTVSLGAMGSLVGDTAHYYYIASGPYAPKSRSWGIYVPETKFEDVGKVFEVQIDNWNFCNPFPDEDPVSSTARIIIIDKPHPEINPIGPFCTNDGRQNLTLSAGAGTGVWSGIGVSGSRFDPEIAGPGLHWIHYMEYNSDNCMGLDSLEVEVFLAPTANFDASATEGCEPLAVTFDNLSADGTTYLWKFGDGTEKTTTDLSAVSHNYTSGSYTMVLEVTTPDGCIDTQTQSIVVHPAVTTDFTSTPSEGCSPLVVKFRDASTNATRYAWDFNEDGRTDRTNSSPRRTFSNSGTTDKVLAVRLISRSDFGCRDTAYHNITIHPTPTVKNTLGDPIGLCVGTQVLLEGNASGGIEPYTHSWSEDTSLLDKTAESEALFTGSLAGSYSILYTLTDVNGCFDTTRFNIRVDSVHVSFPEDTIRLCAGVSSVLQPVIEGGSGVYVVHQWSGDTGNLSSTDVREPDFSSALPGTFNLNYYVEDDAGCSDEANVVVVIYEQPVSEAGDDLQTCGLSIQLHAENPVVGTGVWRVEHGSTGVTIDDENAPETTITVPSFGFYELSWTVINASCSAVDRVGVEFIELPAPDAGEDHAICGLETTLNAAAALGTGWWEVVSGPGVVNFEDSTRNYTRVTVDTPGDYILRWTDDNGAGCLASDDVKLIFNADPIVEFTPDNNSGCAPLTVEFDNASAGGDLYIWNFGDGSVDSVYTSESVIHTFVNSTTDTMNFQVDLNVVSAAGCRASAQTHILVKPGISAGYPINMNGCSPLTVTFPNATATAASWQWIWGDGTADSFERIPTHTFENHSATDTTYIVKLIATSTFGCTDTILNYVTVHSRAIATIGASDTVGCQPLIIDFENLSANATQYFWEFGDGMVDSTANPTHTFTNTTLNDITYAVRLIASNRNGCADTTQQNVLVHPIPMSNFDAVFRPGCSPVTANFVNKSQLATNYEWDFEDGTLSNEINPIHNFYNDSSYVRYFRVRLAAINDYGCRHYSEREVTVYPTQDFDFSISPDSACHPARTMIIAEPGAYTYSWDFGNGNTNSANQYIVLETFTNTGIVDSTYDVTLLASSFYGCMDTTVHPMTVKPGANAELNLSSASGCAPLTVHMENLSSSDATYYWDYGDGRKEITSYAPSFDVTYENPGLTPLIYNLKLVVESASGCRDSVFYPIEVIPGSKAAFASDSVGCSPFTVAFFNESEGAFSLEWDFGDGSVAIDEAFPIHTFINNSETDTSYTVQLISRSTGGCRDTITHDILVHPSRSIDVEFSNTEGCSPLTVAVENTSSNGFDYFIDFGDGYTDSIRVGEVLSHTYTATDHLLEQFDILIQTENSFGCTDSVKQEITVYPEVVAAFDVDTLGCSPLIATFTNQTVGAFSFSWDYGDGSPTEYVQHPVHRFVNTGLNDTTYTVTMVATSLFGCVDTITREMTVSPMPEANFVADTYSGCSPLEVNLTNTSVGGAVFYWDFGNGDVDTTYTLDALNYTYLNAGLSPITYDLTLTVVTSTGCRDSYVVPFRVMPVVTASFESDTVGCSPLQLLFTNNSTGDARYSWNFGDGSPEESLVNPIHTYTVDPATDRYFDVQLLAASFYGCKDSTTQRVHVYGSPEAQLSVKVLNTIGDTTYVRFYNETNGADDYFITFGDGDEVTLASWDSIDHAYPTLGLVDFQYDVSLKAFSGSGPANCPDSLQLSLEGDLPPVANFTPDTAGCSPLVVQFDNLSEKATQFEWNFGDGTPLVRTQEPLHVFTNSTNKDTTYVVQLTVISPYGKVHDTTRTVTVYALPDAGFSIPLSEGCTPFAADFVNESTGADSLYWDFGDGTILATDDTADQSHLYDNLTGYTQNYPVVLTAITNHQCVDQARGEVDVFAAVTAGFTADTIGCSPLEIRFINSSVNAYAYEWNFGDGTPQTGQVNPIHTFVNSSHTDTIYTVQLVAFSADGCIDTLKQDVHVLGIPLLDFRMPITKGCSPFKLNIENRSTPTSTFYWDWGDGTKDTTSYALNVEHVYRNTGVVTRAFRMRVMVETHTGCLDSMEQIIEVNPEVVAGFDYDDIGCSPFAVQFTNTSVGANTLFWDFGDGTIPVAKMNPLHLYKNNGIADTTFTAKLLAESVYGCIDTLSRPVVVHPSPLIEYELLDSIGCAPFVITLNNLSSRGESYFVDFGDGTGDTLKYGASLSHVYEGSTSSELNYRLAVSADNAFGCGEVKSNNIRVFAKVKADFVLDSIGCAPYSVRLTNASEGAYRFEWDFGDGSATEITENPLHLFDNKTLVDTTYQIRLVAHSLYGCTDTIFKAVTVTPSANAAFGISAVEGCSPFTVDFTNLSVSGDVFSWSFGDGTTEITGAGDDVIHTFENNGYSPVTYVVKLVSETMAGCIDSTERNIRVLPAIRAAFETDTAGCAPHAITLTNLSDGAQTYDWDFGDATANSNSFNPVHTYFNDSELDTVYHLSLVATSLYRCVDTTSQAIHVRRSPKAEFELLNEGNCSPMLLTLNNQAQRSDRVIVDFGDGIVDDITGETAVYHEYRNNSNAIMTFDIKMVVENAAGCSDSLTRRVEVLPEVDAIFERDSIGCAPFGVAFENFSYGATSYEWNFGDGTLVENYTRPFHVFENDSDRDTVYHVTLKAFSPYGCVDSMVADVRVHPTPGASFAVASSSGCTPFNAQFENNSFGATTYRWDFGDGTTSGLTDHLISHTYTNSGTIARTVNVNLLAENDFGCVSEQWETVQINPNVVADFEVDTLGCSPFTVQFKNQSGGAYFFDWDFGDKSPVSKAVNPTHTFVNTSQKDIVFRVMLISTSHYGCSDTVWREIHVYPAPVASFELAEQSGCTPFNAVFTNQSVGGKEFEWSFGDGSSSVSGDAEVAHQYLNLSGTTASYPVKLYVQNEIGCAASFHANVDVFPQVTADFEPDKSEGCSPLAINFTNLSLGTSEFMWDFGDGSVSSEFQPRHHFVHNGSVDTTFHVQLISSSVNGCADTATFDIVVFATPKADFSATPEIQMVPNMTVQIDNRTAGGPWDYSWNFGDLTGDVPGNPTSYTYNQPGKYDIALNVSRNSCADQQIQRVVVLPGPPLAVFEPDTVGCPALEIQFSNLSKNGVRYVWDFDDGNYSTQFEPIHTFFEPGVYNVTLQVFNQAGEVDVAQQQIVVHARARAYFSILPNRVRIPGEIVNFSNLSENAAGVLWDFGDGTTSSEYEPTHEYTKVGVYDVSLYVTTSENCRDTFSVISGVEAYSVARVQVPNAFTPSKEGPSSGNYTLGDRYNRVFYPVIPKGDVEQYQLQIFNRWGNLLFVSHTLDRGWDGYYNGKLCSQDVYIWRVKVTFSDGTDYVEAGDLTLIQ